MRAAKIVHAMAQAHGNERGAVGLEGEMIDAPMLKQVQFLLVIVALASAHAKATSQAEKTIQAAKAAGLEIPSF